MSLFVCVCVCVRACACAREFDISKINAQKEGNSFYCIIPWKIYLLSTKLMPFKKVLDWSFCSNQRCKAKFDIIVAQLLDCGAFRHKEIVEGCEPESCGSM
jgi:hypothetical protein